jgi:NAD(P)-dependent dehydrogenase (short-subunit alcohol dehydrogenase family)
MSEERIVVMGTYPVIGLGIARKLADAGHRNVVVIDREQEQMQIERAKSRELAAYEYGKRAGSRESQDRIKAMQMRKTREAAEKNARRAYNQMRGKK